MSDDTTLQKYLRRNRSESLSDGADGGTEHAETVAGCFGFLRGARERAMCLELRRRSGHVLAVNYSYISRFEYDPSIGIVLHNGGEAIKITGSNLNAPAGPKMRLFEAICRHKVSWICESDRTSRMASEADEVVIATIEW